MGYERSSFNAKTINTPWQSSVQQNKSEYFGIAQVIRENLKRNETLFNQHLQNHTNLK